MLVADAGTFAGASSVQSHPDAGGLGRFALGRFALREAACFGQQPHSLCPDIGHAAPEIAIVWQLAVFVAEGEGPTRRHAAADADCPATDRTIARRSVRANQLR